MVVAASRIIRDIQHSPLPEEGVSGLGAIQFESSDVDAFDSVSIETNGKCAIDMYREDLIRAGPASIELGRRVNSV
jgi:hypothetical protein